MASSQDLNRIIRATLSESKANAVAALDESVEDSVVVAEAEEVEAEADEVEVDADAVEDEVVEEEVEQIDEISTKLATSYANKAQKKADKHWVKSDELEDKAMETDGRKEPGKSKQAALSKKAGEEIDSWKKRTKGVNTAVSKLSDKDAKKVKPSGLWGQSDGRKPGTAKVKATKEEVAMDEVENNLDETAAADSLKPAARSVADPKSKVDVIAQVLGHMHAMKKTDLLKWYTDAQSQFGPGKTYGVGDNSGKNSSTLDMNASAAAATVGPKTKHGMPKLNVKEDVEALFEGQDLSEEFKDNMTTLFEAAVNAAILAETARLEEAFEEAFEEAVDEQVEALTEEVTAKLDAYLDAVVESWMEENAVAIESTLRNEVVDEFMDGLKNLFAEHYIEVPQHKVDVLEALAEKVEALEAKLDESITENAELKSHLTEAQKSEIFAELASDLALTQQEKFAALAEGIEFDGDLDRYARKLSVIKEGYFKKKEVATSTNLDEETFEGEEISESIVHVDPTVGRYVQAITRNVKK